MTAEVGGKLLPLTFVRDDGGTAIVLLIDVSGGMKGAKFETVRAIASALLGRLSPTDRAAIVATGSHTFLLANFTDNPQTMIRALDQLRPDDFSSNLISGLRTANALANSTSPNLPHRRVIVALTDGLADDAASAAAAAASLMAHSVPIYSMLQARLELGHDTRPWSSLVAASQGAMISVNPGTIDAGLERMTGLIGASFHLGPIALSVRAKARMSRCACDLRRRMRV